MTATTETTEHYLESRIPLDDLSQLLLPRDEWRPFPPIADRAGWATVPDRLRSALIAEAESLLDFGWPHLPATLFLEYARIGNRIYYEEFHFARRRNLITLVLAECLEAKGRFLDQIVNGIWALCEESFWGVPAHNRPRFFAGSGLPDVDDHYVDLFAAETGALLAWTHYLLRSAIAVEVPVVLNRIEGELQDRILQPYRERDDFVWLGFEDVGRHPNNWNPWIHSNVLAVDLLIEADAESRASTAARCIRGIDRFLAGYEPDGGCDEGIMYWGRAGASLFDCLEVLRGASGNRIDLYGESLIQEIGRYPYRMHIGGQWFVNFADGGAKVDLEAGLTYRYGSRIQDARLQALGIEARAFEGVQPPRIVSMARGLGDLFEPIPESHDPAAKSFVRDAWLPGIEVLTSHERADAEDGLFLAAKGGHNGESHNHNDIGSFIIGLDGRPLVIDVGVETYSRKTFSPQRYDIWTMQSGYHNLPAIDGHDQLPGKEYGASDVQCDLAADRASLSLDIAGAYGAAAGAAAWHRTATLQRGDDARVDVVDRFELDHQPDSLIWNIMTARQVDEVSPGVLRTGDVGHLLDVRFDAARLSAAFEEIPITDGRLHPVWGNSVWRTRLTAKDPSVSGEVRITVARG